MQEKAWRLPSALWCVEANRSAVQPTPFTFWVHWHLSQRPVVAVHLMTTVLIITVTVSNSGAMNHKSHTSDQHKSGQIKLLEILLILQIAQHWWFLVSRQFFLWPHPKNNCTSSKVSANRNAFNVLIAHFPEYREITSVKMSFALLIVTLKLLR